MMPDLANPVLWAITLLGLSSYFLLLRCWLENRNPQTATEQDGAWLHHMPALVSALPLLGLLGTISGLLGTFRAMALPGSVGSAQLTDGIADALLTTQYGLAMAIPGWLLLAWLRHKLPTDGDH